MNPKNSLTGDQWDFCDRCGILHPIGDLARQRGLLLCEKDMDNLDVERRELIIAEILGGDNNEGADLRVVDKAFDILGEDII